MQPGIHLIGALASLPSNLTGAGILPGREARQPAGYMAFVAGIVFRVAAGERRLFIQPDEEVNCQAADGPFDHQPRVPEQYRTVTEIGNRNREQTAVHPVPSWAAAGLCAVTPEWEKPGKGSLVVDS